MKLLVCGAGGMLGQDVVLAAERAGHEVVALDRLTLDVTDGAAVGAAVDRSRPGAVINCAAYTNVDGAEDETDEALRVNAEGARNVAAEAARHEAVVIYPSTDYVFDGSAGRAYVESDQPNPPSSYGRSKLAGEQETAAANERHHVVRSSWLFGTGGRNFVKTMLGLAERQDEVKVVNDQVGSPTYTFHLAEGLVRLLDSDAHGVRHMAAAGECSWYDFAVEIFRQAEVSCRVTPCTTDETGRPAPRPAHSTLVSELPDAVELPDWRAGLEAYLGKRA